MPMMALNLALLFVFGLAPVQFFLSYRENLLHGFSQFIGPLLNLVRGDRHVAQYALSRGSAILANQFRIITLIPSNGNGTECETLLPVRLY